jgi:CspA family cold shock protein
MKGNVIWFNESKGIGYIKEDESGREFSAHFSDIKRKGFRTLFAGERVSFDIEKTQFNSLRAINIELVKD